MKKPPPPSTSPHTRLKHKGCRQQWKVIVREFIGRLAILSASVPVSLSAGLIADKKVRPTKQGHNSGEKRLYMRLARSNE